ncbi:MAG: ATP-dependent DNA helicase RecG [Phycisphaerae bacterium]|nr:ATP-dependent DNA helicase RecG [Phycisphaerae bacterium]
MDQPRPSSDQGSRAERAPERSASLSLTTVLGEIPGITPARRRALADLGVTKVGHLMAYLPMRHEQLEPETPIGELAAGRLVSARGTVAAVRPVMMGRKPRLEAALMDATGRLDLTWFNGLYLRETIHPGVRLRVMGKARRFGRGLQIANPKFEILGDEENEPELRQGRVRPVYPASEAIRSEAIELCVGRVLGPALACVEDHLGEAYVRERDLPGLAEAYRMMHAPASLEEAAAGRRRLAYDELLLMQLAVQMKRAHLRRTLRAPALRWSVEVDRRIRELIPFPLTVAQDAVVREVVEDLRQEIPTNRLIQGDVGSGKTAVALYALLMAAATGHQGALMVPTELLAEQHGATLRSMLGASSVRLDVLTASRSAADRASVRTRLESGELDLVVGTHALLTEGVRFRSLAVTVIDEQHRFGVAQRALLREKGGEAVEGERGGTEPRSGGGVTPHVLVMTATPIPRTLALTLFGDLDISTIRGLPPGRRPVATRVVPPERALEVYAYVRKRLDRGEQAYVVAPTIDGAAEAGADMFATSEGRGVPAGREARGGVREVASELERGAFAGKRVGVLHGRLSAEARDATIARFRSGAIDALVCTTIIEVGVDVPNATVMVVEQAERFGLAQLHQLRGRVGRGSKKSVCVLIGDSATPEAAHRLKAVAESADGFALAERDLALRGPGEILGLRQSGMPPLKAAALPGDLDLLLAARRDAAAWIERSRTLSSAGEALLKRRLLKAHGPWIGLADVG